MLVLWMNRLPLMQEDLREIPANMQSFLESPPRPLSDFTLNTDTKLALTNDWLIDKWSFVYFSHSHCLPDCRVSLDKIKAQKAAFSNADIQFLIIGLDSEHEDASQLTTFLAGNNYDFTAATGSTKQIDRLSREFIALFLKTGFTNGSYQIEQEHHIFLVDPKGRLYATFRPNERENLASLFTLSRQFYARTE